MQFIIRHYQQVNVNTHLEEFIASVVIMEAGYLIASLLTSWCPFFQR